MGMAVALGSRGDRSIDFPGGGAGGSMFVAEGLTPEVVGLLMGDMGASLLGAKPSSLLALLDSLLSGNPSFKDFLSSAW